MTREFTEEENRAWRAKQPQKMIVAKVVIQSGKGNILLAKSSYKKSWQMPGGGVEDGESPEEAAIREVQEELGLALPIDSLTIKGTIYKKDEEILFMIYECNKRFPEDIKLTTQEDEVTDFKFVDTTDAASLLSPYYANFWKQHYNYNNLA